MTKPGSGRPFKTHRYRFAGALRGRVGVVALVVAAISLDSAPLAFSDQPLSHSQIAEASKPGTIMIYTQWTTSIIVAPPQPNWRLLIQFANYQARRGLIQNTSSAKIMAAFDELLRHPDRYLTPSESIAKEVHAGASGSGFVVTPDGYVVTNAHVVYADKDTLRNAVIENWQGNEMKELVVEDFNKFKKQFETALQTEVPEDMIGRFVSAEKDYYLRNMQIRDVQTQVFALMGVAIPGLPTQPRGIPADVRKQGDPVPGKDVAILKIEQNNLPTVPVGDDSTMKVGDTILVLGYPGAAEINKQQIGVESTLTQGDLSARKAMPGGWSALQTSAEINHGNSGGPAFNDRGEVIGIATFGPNEASVRGINFLVPIGVAKEFLNELNVKPHQSRLSELYEQGIADMSKNCYKGSLEKFKEVSDLSPGFPFVQDKITQSRNAIDQGLDRCWMPSPVYIAGSVGVVLVILAAVWLLMRRRTAVGEVVGVGPPPAPPVVLDAQAVKSPLELAPGPTPQGSMSFGTLQASSGALAGKRFEVTKQGLLIGRDPLKCQIVVNDEAVSKEHAWVVPLDGGGTVVIDRGSTNGTYINSADSPKINKVRLNNGDKIVIGKGVAVFTYHTS